MTVIIGVWEITIRFLVTAMQGDVTEFALIFNDAICKKK